MIVRIMGEGQFDLPPESLKLLDELDDHLLGAVRQGDEADFRATLSALLAAARQSGRALPPESLESSELVLPAEDATLDEVREMLSEDGLIAEGG
ncbi:PspA-associated protein PspAA [Allostreptomyces psammosilenae]|uniref:PspA-associated domain-containing protein n=1 Tax=Allostreptomyces psammosilenae TaxID=1892865 RepID=A0A853A0M5_9ACTN|nr:hypothetical protein [Allostreptomyces psammosilenae]NYI07010.1 hypothetical protein [Allostreptomyces psammosilenae]